MMDKDCEKAVELTFQEKLDTYTRDIEVHNAKNLVNMLLYSTAQEDLFKVCIKPQLYEDLEIFSAQGSEPVIEALDKTLTISGRVCLEHIIKTPIRQIEKLTARQNTIRELCSKRNVENVEKIKEHLLVIKDKEKHVLWFWETPSEEIQSLYDLVYFNTKFGETMLNDTDELLTCSSFYTILVSPISTIAGPLLTTLVPMVLLKLFTNTESNNLSLNFGKILWLLFKAMFKIDVLKQLPIKALVTTLVGMFLWLMFYIYSIYSAITNAINTNTVINKLHEKIRAVANFAEHVERIFAITSSKQLCLPLSDQSVEQALHNCRRLFENYNGTVMQSPQLFNNKGLILRTYRRFMNMKEIIVPLFAFVATVDCYMSCSRLVESHGYCYPDYNLNSQNKIKKLWHPSFDKDAAVKNSVRLSNMMITGPNAAGKSTFIKSVALAILTAQTIGLASASKMVLTPFDNIYSYLRIPDCKGSESLFEAEMHRCKEYLDILEKSTSKRSFIVIDEIFSSTNYKEGLSAAYAVCKKLISYPANTSIITTHYTPLTSLEKDTNNPDTDTKITNYRFNANVNSDKITYTYKIEKGVSDQYIALKILSNDGYDKDIITDALEMCDRVRLNIIEKNISNS